MPSPSGGPVPQTGKIAIVAIAVLGVLFFGLMQLSKNHFRQAAEHTPSVVVLPSRVFGSTDKIYMTDAFPSSLSTLLTRAAGIDVKVGPTSLEQSNPEGNLAQTATAAHAATIVTSTVTVEADDLTFNVQLLDPVTRGTLWSKQCKGKLEDYNELVRQAADGIAHTLQPSSPRLAAATGLAGTSEAELADRRGEYYFALFTKLHEAAAFDQALNAFHLALALDPSLKSAANHIAQLKPDKVQR